MIAEQELSSYYTALKEIFSKALDDTVFFLEKTLRECPDKEVARIYASSTISKRPKTFDSVLRKVRRDGIASVDAIPESIEDILGIRISTPNKVQASKLYDWFQSIKGNWFCSIAAEPKFVPYTIEDRNKYSLRTGYQAYHITFQVEREYAPFTANHMWPCELQIMSKVWEFWANYSRQYFYATSGPEVTQFLPYNTVISKILDSADDLMVATTELLLSSGREPEGSSPAGKLGPQTSAAISETHRSDVVTVDDVRNWLQANIANIIDPRAKVPNEFFIAKIADELNTYGVSLVHLEKILHDQIIKDKYEKLLKANGRTYLPVYQQILCMILLHLSLDIEVVIERVNSQLLPLGLRLHAPDGAS